MKNCENCLNWRYYYHLDKEYPYTTDRKYSLRRLQIIDESNSTKVGLCIRTMSITGNKADCGEGRGDCYAVEEGKV